MADISVIVPAYNVEVYLHRCVDSILNQTHTGFELILVDDGSADNSGAMCDEYVLSDERLCVIHQPNGGLSAACNSGLDLAFDCRDCEWIFFVDSDDWIYERSFEALLDGAVKTGSELVIGFFGGTDGAALAVDEAGLSPVLCDPDDFICRYYVCAVTSWGKLYRKKCFSDIRFPLGKTHEDEFVTYKILFKYDWFAVIFQPLYAYFNNPNGIMNSKWTPARLDAFQAMEERMVFFRERGNNTTYMNSLSTMIWVYLAQINQIRTLDNPEKRKYLRMVKAKMIRFIFAVKNEFTFRENKSLYWEVVDALSPMMKTLHAIYRNMKLRLTANE